MQWECHSCQMLHPNIPSACSRCGTEPDVVKNVWQCAYCKKSGNDCTQGRCSGCGRDRDARDAVAVDPDQKVAGPRGIALASGDTLVCGFCGSLCPPVNERGDKPENCPTCQGPLDVAQKKIADEVVSAACASQYAAPATEPASSSDVGVRAALSGPPAEPHESLPSPPPSTQMPRLAPIILGSLALMVTAYCIVAHYSKDLNCTVLGRSWSRSVRVERLQVQQRSGWHDSFTPAGASCALMQHGTRSVQVGFQTTYSMDEDRSKPCLRGPEYAVTTQVKTGQKCTGGTKYVKRGTVSVAQCAGWSPTYSPRVSLVRDCVGYPRVRVPHTSPTYAEVPRMDSFCSWEESVWVYSRTLQSSGWDLSPRDPPMDLQVRERASGTQDTYNTQLSCPSLGGAGPLAHEVGYQDWQRLAPGTRVVAKMWGQTVRKLLLP